MADKIYDAQVNINYGDAFAQTRELTGALDGLDGLFHTLSEDGGELETTFLRQIDVVNRLRGKVDDVTDQLKLFGEGGVQAANMLEEIADPSRRIAAGLELVKLAAAAAATEEAKLADEASVAAAKFELQDAATKRLLESTRRLRPQYAGAIGEIEKISNGTRRAAAAQELFAKASQPVSGVERLFSGLQDEVGAVQARFAALPPLMQGAVLGAIGAVTAGAIALATAVGTTLVDAWQAWAAQSREAQEIQQDLDDSTNRLMVSLGELTEQVGRVTDAQAGASAVADETTGVLDSFNAAMRDADPATRRNVEAIGQLNRQMAQAIPGIGGLVAGVWNLSDALADVGEREREQLGLLRATNPELLLLTASLDRGAEAARGAGGGVLEVDAALRSATIGARDFEAGLRDLETRWERIEQWDAPAALGAITGAAGGAEGEEKSRREKARAEREKALADHEKFIVSVNERIGAVEIEQRERAIERVQAATLARIEETSAINDQAAALRAWGDALQESTTRGQAGTGALTARTRELDEALNSATDASIAFGINTAAGIAQALIAGDSLGGMWRSALADLGTFARNTGQTLILAGLGKSALDLGLPGPAIVGIGAGLVGLGVTLGGLFGGSRGGAAPRPQAQLAAQRDTWAQRNADAQTSSAPPAVTVVAQFGDDRLEPTVVRLEESARRNGRTSSGGRY